MGMWASLGNPTEQVGGVTVSSGMYFRRTLLWSLCEAPGGGREWRHGAREALSPGWGVFEVIDAG